MARPDNWRELVKEHGWGTAPERLKARSRRRGKCVEWTGPLSNGVGQFRVSPRNGKSVWWLDSAQRVAWMLKNRCFIPDGMSVKRTCCNERCISHLALVPHGTYASRCELLNHHKAVRLFTGAEVREIRKAHDDGQTFESLAKEWGVSFHSIFRLYHRQTYAEIT